MSVVPLFTLSSFLLMAFALGVWLSSGHSRLLRLMAAMFAGSALVGVVLWNFFPMHMRGAEPTFTDTMHLILATNPFVLLSVILLLPAVFAFQYAPEVQANLPTPGLGLGERVGQYAYALWQSALAIVLLRKRNGEAHQPISRRLI